MRAATRWIRILGLNVLVAIVLLVLVEGANRMAETDLSGYAKPILSVSSTGLDVGNVPVPEGSRLAGTRREEVRSTIRRLRVIEFGRLALRKLGFEARKPNESSAETDSAEATARVFHVLLDSLVAIDQRKGSLLVLVHLPQEHELSGLELDADLAFWQERLRAESTARGIPYIDLVSELRELPAHRATAMFMHQDIQNLIGSAGHYTEEGNAWVADRIHARLNDLPEFREKLESLRSSNEPGTR